MCKARQCSEQDITVPEQDKVVQSQDAKAPLHKPTGPLCGLRPCGRTVPDLVTQKGFRRRLDPDRKRLLVDMVDAGAARCVSAAARAASHGTHRCPGLEKEECVRYLTRVRVDFDGVADFHVPCLHALVFQGFTGQQGDGMCY